MAHSKPKRRWLATVSDSTYCIHAISWYLARQEAAVVTRRDPDDIAVRLAPVA